MQATQILKAIRGLSFQEKMLILEEIFKEMKKDVAPANTETNSIAEAANALLDDYKNDPELTAFSNIDQDEFYEA